MGGDFQMKNCHGGDIYSKNVIYDFSANINPLGMPESVKTAIIDHIEEYEHYPDINCTQLCDEIAAHENTDSGNILCGNGAADLIYRIVRTVKPQKALIPIPSFSEYEKALSSIGCETEYFFMNEGDNFRLNSNILDRLDGIDMLILCSPNNPTGNIIDRELLRRISEKCRLNNILLVIDECFMDFVQNSDIYRMSAAEKHIIILKAFTKIYAMAGLRLGYIICSDRELLKRVAECGQCWSVSVPAQITGIAALSEQEYVEKTVQIISKERKYLTEQLEKSGFRVFPSDANFILFRCNLPLDELLMQKHISIRNCSNYRGLDGGYFRIAVRTHAENQILINAIENIKKSETAAL
jgi:threonine-phosphate decarboxylase